jgi:hypothetical protein
MSNCSSNYSVSTKRHSLLETPGEKYFFMICFCSIIIINNLFRSIFITSITVSCHHITASQLFSYFHILVPVLADK